MEGSDRSYRSGGIEPNSAEQLAHISGPSGGGGASAGGPSGGLTLAGRRRRIPPKLYRIGEVVAYSGVSRQTIHNYTTMGLLREKRWTDGGHRLFDESVFHRLDRIDEMKAQGKSLQDIRDYFALSEQ